VPDFTGIRVGDFGCGYNALFTESLLEQVAGLVLIDVSLSRDLKRDPKVTAIEGELPLALERLDTGSLDVILLNSVLEHLWDPDWALAEAWRVVKPGGKVLINVPSWRGKRWLEFSAFKLGTSPPEEMDDHKTYYDLRDLWPLLVRAGFKPSKIKCHRHKFGLNTWAECTR
jgi:SAM-dependent methyltransferase